MSGYVPHDYVPRPRIPDVGRDGLRRLDCVDCGKLLCRFPASARSDEPFEFKCTDSKCKKLNRVWFNAGGEVLRKLGVGG